MDRQTATRRIERIVQAIEEGKFPARVRELHVFGSYARGALDPGDLDLILIHDPAPEMVARLRAEFVEKYGEHVLDWPRNQRPERKFDSLMRAVMRRPGEKMDILLGTSMAAIDQQGLNIGQSDRLLIWSDSDRNWREKLDSITPDPEAGRHERAHFANLKRFRGEARLMLNVTEAVSQGLLKLTRIDAEQVEPVLNPLYQHWCDHWERCGILGKNSLKLLRHGLWWMQEQRGQSCRQPGLPRRDGTISSDDGRFTVHLGNPPLYAVYRLCEGDHRTVRVCLIPHFKKGEPNQMFVFENGDRTDQQAWEQIMRQRHAHE